MKDDVEQSADEAKLLFELFPDAAKTLRALIDPNNDGTATSKELIAYMGAQVETYLRSPEGMKLSDGSQEALSMDTLMNAPEVFRKSLGSFAPKIEPVSQAEAKAATARILARVRHGRERTL